MNVEGKLWPSRLLTLPVPCPSCRLPVRGFSGRNIDKLNASDASLVTYTLYPCYCTADQFWMTAFAAEMDRRAAGKSPRNVEAQSKENRSQAKGLLIARLASLYTFRDATVVAGATQRKAAIERDICLLVTELHRLDPAEKAWIRAIVLEPEVLQWASQKRLAVPEGSTNPVADRTAVTLEQIHDYLKSDTEFAAASTSRKLGVLAQAVHQELQDYVHKGKPVSRLTLTVITRLLPDAGKFLIARETDGPVIEDVEKDFVDALTKRKKRRIGEGSQELDNGFP